MKNYPDNLHVKSQTGFSIVELMVGLVIALFGILIMFQVFTTSEGIKRTTTSGGDAQQNGAAALFYVARSLKAAGYGIFWSQNATNSVPAYPADLAATVPVTITAGSATSSDSLVLTYRQNWTSGSFAPPVIPQFALPPPLTFETISVVATGNLTQLQSTTVNDKPAYATSGVPATGTSDIADGIVLMKAEYGYDTNSDGVVDTWSPTAIAGTVLAIRIVIVARSAQPEVTVTAASGVGGACKTTTTAPTWAGTNLTTDNPTAVTLNLSGNLGLAAGDSWQCYRYKTFETIVPIRNDV